MFYHATTPKDSFFDINSDADADADADADVESDGDARAESVLCRLQLPMERGLLKG